LLGATTAAATWADRESREREREIQRHKEIEMEQARTREMAESTNSQSSGNGSNGSNENRSLQDLNYYDRMMQEAQMLQQTLNNKLASPTTTTRSSAATTTSSSFATTTTTKTQPVRSPPLVAAALQRQGIASSSTPTAPTTTTSSSNPHLFDPSSIEWTNAIVVQVNPDTCDVISSVSSHVATVPYHALRVVNATHTYSPEDLIQVFMPIDHQWEAGTVVRMEAVVTNRNTCVRVKLNAETQGATEVEDSFVVPFNLIRWATLKESIDVGTQVEVMNVQSLKWKDGYTRVNSLDGALKQDMDPALDQELTPSTMLVRHLSGSGGSGGRGGSGGSDSGSGSLHQKKDSMMDKWGVLEGFQAIRAVDGRNIFPMPIYFVKNALTGLHPKKEIRPIKHKKKDGPTMNGNEGSLVDGMMRKAVALKIPSSLSNAAAGTGNSVIVHGKSTLHRGQSVDMGHGHYNKDDIVPPSLLDYSIVRNRLQNTYSDYSEHNQADQNATSPASFLYSKIFANSATNATTATTATTESTTDSTAADHHHHHHHQERRSNESALEYSKRLRLNELSRGTHELYRTVGWTSPNEKQIKTDQELEIRKDVTARIEQFQSNFHARQQQRQQERRLREHRRGITRMDPRGPGSGNRGRGRRQGGPHSYSPSARNKWSPSKEWNSSIAVEKDRRPTLRHTVFDEHHTYEHPYQPKPFVPIPREIIQHSGIGSEKNLPHLYKREIDQRLLEMKEQEEREEREERETTHYIYHQQQQYEQQNKHERDRHQWAQQQEGDSSFLRGADQGADQNEAGVGYGNPYYTGEYHYDKNASVGKTELDAQQIFQQLGKTDLAELHRIAAAAQEQAPPSYSLATPNKPRRKDGIDNPNPGRTRTPEGERERREIANQVQRRVVLMQQEEESRNALLRAMREQPQQQQQQQQQPRSKPRARRRNFRESGIKQEDRHGYDAYEKSIGIDRGRTPWTNGLNKNDVTKWVTRSVPGSGRIGVADQATTDHKIIQRLGENETTSQRRGSFFGTVSTNESSNYRQWSVEK